MRKLQLVSFIYGLLLSTSFITSTGADCIQTGCPSGEECCPQEYDGSYCSPAGCGEMKQKASASSKRR